MEADRFPKLLASSVAVTATMARLKPGTPVAVAMPEPVAQARAATARPVAKLSADTPAFQHVG